MQPIYTPRCEVVSTPIEQMKHNSDMIAIIPRHERRCGILPRHDAEGRQMKQLCATFWDYIYIFTTEIYC